MIPIQRSAPPAEVVADLRRRTERLVATEADGEAARKEWANGAETKQRVRDLLGEMAPGRTRCMYCLDNVGTDIDHFEPLTRAPLRAFDWPNHLLACARCNSKYKRELFPCDEDTGEPLLIDPTAQDPSVDLQLRPEVGEYATVTPRGEQTARLFQLNGRQELIEGRRFFYELGREQLVRWHELQQAGECDRAASLADGMEGEALLLAVLRAMVQRYTRAPATLQPQLRAALAEWIAVRT